MEKSIAEISSASTKIVRRLTPSSSSRYRFQSFISVFRHWIAIPNGVRIGWSLVRIGAPESLIPQVRQRGGRSSVGHSLQQGFFDELQHRDATQHFLEIVQVTAARWYAASSAATIAPALVPATRGER
jgi:hypothetical protein